MVYRRCIFTILILTLVSNLAAGVPPESKYQILNDTKRPGIKRSIEVHLSERVTKAELRRIALKLRKSDSSRYPNTFINYRLPGMYEGAASWATTHFTPKLDVRIQGLTRGQVGDLAARPSRKEVLGSWIDDGGIAPAIVTIERGSAGLVMRRTFPGGGVLDKPLKESGGPRPGTKFHYKEGARFGDHLRISSTGNLEFWDNDGLIASAPKQ